MGLVGGIGRVLTIPLLLLNLAFATIILGLAGHYLDRDISGYTPGTGELAGFNGNRATFYLVIFSLIAGVVAIASYLAGLHHLRVWRAESGGGSQAAAWIAWLLLIIAFCLAWKEIHIGRRGVKARVLEAFVIMLTVTHFIYTVLIHLGHKDHHTNDGLTGHKNKPLNPNASTATAA